MSDIQKIKATMTDVFAGTDLPDDISGLKMDDFKEWDSVGNFNLLLAIEDSFGISFEIDEITTIRSVSQILESLEKK